MFTCKFLPRRLGTQITLVISVLLCLLIAVYTWHISRYNMAWVNSATKQQAEIMAHGIAALAVGYMLTDDFAAIEGMLLRNGASPNVVQLAVTDKEGNQVSHIARLDDSTVKVIYETEKYIVPNTEQTIVNQLEKKIISWHPIEYSGLIGWVKVEYSLRTDEEIKKKLIKGATGAGFALLVSCIVFIMLFMRRYLLILSEISDFSARMKNLSGEQLTLKPVPLEIESLLNTLNNTSLVLRNQNKSLIASETRLRTIINASISAIILINEEKIIELFNPAAEKMFGYKAEDTIGRPVTMLMPEPYKSKHDHYVERYIKTGVKNVIGSSREVKAMRKNGTIFPIELAVSEMFVESKRMFVGLISNITERKRYEEGLQIAHEKLKEQNVILAESAERAEAASLAKSNFLAGMSHEIRTPMNAILGMADLLGESELTDEQRQYVNTFKNAGENLLNIINDILDISKIEAGAFVLEHICFDLREVVERVGDIMAVRAHHKSLELLNDISPQVPSGLVGDPTRLHQVLVNLIGNAIKFTPHGEIVVSVECLAQDEANTTLRFSVKDTGIGIPREQHAMIFETFQQADTSTTRKYGGTGLGLSITKQIVEMMQGEIGLESEPGRGSIFSFTARFGITMPCNQSVKAEKIDLGGRRIMTVDDNSTNLMILSKMLSNWNAEAITANNAEECMAKILEADKAGVPIDLALLDYHMPIMNGLDLGRKIKLKMPSLPIVILSSSDASIDTMARIKDIGLSGYCTKPVKYSALKSILLTALAMKMPEKKKKSDQSEKRSEIPPMTILMAEDNVNNRDLISAYLKKTSVTIDFAENGKIAVDKFKGKRYDLVFMDIEMPEMDGYTATRAIRLWEAEEGRQKTPIVALTAHALKEHEMASAEAGCDGHLTKPIKKSLFLNILQGYFKG
ncbi:MAG: response regulator [Desulfobulbaceae bacterium]|nr:response regulator [Desulfobulbaceae bacterium]